MGKPDNLLRFAPLFGLLLAACTASGSPDDPPTRFTVAPGSGLAAVADTLSERGIIDAPALAFRLYGQVRRETAVKPGIYEVQGGTSWDAILRKLTSGDIVRESLTIPEGWTAAQIAERIASLVSLPVDSVLPLLMDTTAPGRWELPGPTLEGYLYPATYILPAGLGLDKTIETLVGRYREVWTPELRARAAAEGLTEREVVTLASIVEKEAKRWTERDTIAAVYRNRLRIGMPLQADPTVQYARGSHATRLLYAHIDEVADHPYNTYTHAGLPPGPIASPSEGSIKAVLAPAKVPYLYFVARPDGTHVFTSSLAEHNRAKVRIRAQIDALNRQAAARQR